MASNGALRCPQRRWKIKFESYRVGQNIGPFCLKIGYLYVESFWPILEGKLWAKPEDSWEYV